MAGFTEIFERVKLNPVGIRFERGKNGQAGRIVTVSFQVRDMSFDALQRMADAAIGKQEVQIEVRFPQAAMDMDEPPKEQGKLLLGEDGYDAREDADVGLDLAIEGRLPQETVEEGVGQQLPVSSFLTTCEQHKDLHRHHEGRCLWDEDAALTRATYPDVGRRPAKERDTSQDTPAAPPVSEPADVGILLPGLVPGYDARAQGITQPEPDPVLLHEVDLAARAIKGAGKDMGKMQEAMKGVVDLDGKYPEAGVIRMVQVRVAYLRPSPESDDVLWDAAGAYHPGMVEMDNGKKRRPYVHPGWDPQVSGNGDKVKWLTSKGHWSAWVVVTPDSVKRLMDARRVLLDAAEMAAGAVYRTCPDHPQPHRHQGNHCGWEWDRTWRNVDTPMP